MTNNSNVELIVESEMKYQHSGSDTDFPSVFVLIGICELTVQLYRASDDDAFTPVNHNLPRSNEYPPQERRF